MSTDCNNIPMQYVKLFVQEVSIKYNIDYDELVDIFDKVTDLTIDECVEVISINKKQDKANTSTKEVDNMSSPMSVSSETDIVVSAFCTATKKDGTICGKKSTHGDKCGVHKGKLVQEVTPVSKEDAAPVLCIALKKDGKVCGKKATLGNLCGVHKSYKPVEQKPVENIEVATSPVKDVVVSSTCVATKKDGTVCGKKSTHGDKCGVHKKSVTVVQKQSEQVQEPVEVDKPTSQQEENVETYPSVCQGETKTGKRCKTKSVYKGYCKLHQDQIPQPEPKYVLKDVNFKKLEVNPRLGLLFDRTNSRFVFSKSSDDKYTVIGRYSHRFTVLTEEDIQNCGLLGLEYKIVQLHELAPEYPLIDDEEYKLRIPYFIELDRQREEEKNTLLRKNNPIVEQQQETVVEVAQPTTLQEVVSTTVEQEVIADQNEVHDKLPETQSREAEVSGEQTIDETTADFVFSVVSEKDTTASDNIQVLEENKQELPVEVVDNVIVNIRGISPIQQETTATVTEKDNIVEKTTIATTNHVKKASNKGAYRVKNLSKDPKHFPKKPLKCMDIVEALDEITEPLLTDSQVN